MELSLVIPVWNDLEGLGRLLKQVAELDLFSEVIVMDDASDVPPGPGLCPAGLSGRISWIRSDIQRGAGHARNAALERVRGSHVIFFDSDDMFTEDFSRIAELAAVEKEPFDFLIFRHDDSRITAQGGNGALPDDEMRWRAIGAGGKPQVLSLDQATRLCRVAAYPWNKIYRTGFLRDHRIRCTETMVHNDIELHWNSFIAARRILTCALPGAIHFVQEGGRRLTNRRSADRLEVFRALENVMPRITAGADYDKLAFLQPFVRFSCDLVSWVGKNIEGEYHPELLIRAQQHFLGSLDRRLMTMIAYVDPALARKVNRLVLQGELP